MWVMDYSDIAKLAQCRIPPFIPVIRTLTRIKIYNEEVRDLLAVGAAGDKRDKLELKEDPNKGVYVKVCTVHLVTSPGSQELGVHGKF